MGTTPLSATSLCTPSSHPGASIGASEELADAELLGAELDDGLLTIVVLAGVELDGGLLTVVVSAGVELDGGLLAIVVSAGVELDDGLLTVVVLEGGVLTKAVLVEVSEESVTIGSELADCTELDPSEEPIGSGYVFSEETEFSDEAISDGMSGITGKSGMGIFSFSAQPVNVSRLASSTAASRILSFFTRSSPVLILS